MYTYIHTYIYIYICLFVAGGHLGVRLHVVRVLEVLLVKYKGFVDNTGVTAVGNSDLRICVRHKYKRNNYKL